ncbi:hypothetical protein EON81_13995 [bacterium]|nr:MAG: hypothetical protein EON81_13995 [bacterium]
MLSWIIPALAAVWLVLCHIAPYLPGTNPLGIVFGMAPPMLLVAPPILALIALTTRVVLHRNPKRDALLGLAILLATVPLLSLQWGRPQKGKGVSVMTFNVNKDSRKMPGLLDYLLNHETDVVFLQENKGSASSPANFLKKGLPGWHMVSAGEVAILSRWPIENVRAVPMRSQTTRILLTAEIAGPRRFRALTVHWSVPQFGKGLRSMRNGAVHQESDYQQTLDLIRGDDLPLLLGGDFNNPPRHALTRKLSNRLENCFSTCGSGIGLSYPSRNPYTRIDHFYVNRGFETLGAQVGPDLGSDHLPLLAKIAFR